MARNTLGRLAAKRNASPLTPPTSATISISAYDRLPHCASPHHPVLNPRDNVRSCAPFRISLPGLSLPPP
eukprot:5204113-Pleurochrysis_carterae.AAC.1